MQYSFIMTTVPGVAHTSKNPDLGKQAPYSVGPVGRTGDEDPAQKSAAVEALMKTFGPDLSLQMRQPFDLAVTPAPRYGTRGHATTGIPYAISGTAAVVEMDIGERLMAFSDPIRAILGTGVHTSQKIIVKRQYPAGGGASIVPERGACRRAQPCRARTDHLATLTPQRAPTSPGPHDRSAGGRKGGAPDKVRHRGALTT